MRHYDPDNSVSGGRARRPVPPPVRRAVRELASAVEAWRKLRGLTQAQLADRAGLNRETLARLESGDGGVSIGNLLRILRALGLLDILPRAIDPYESDVGRLRADEQLPKRVRPRSLKGQDDG
jgi:transcriptional regulator with XRE-family HTH domain